MVKSDRLASEWMSPCSLIKWHGHNLRPQQFSSHIDFNALTNVCEINRHVSHPDVLFQKWRRTSGSDVAGALAVNKDVLTITRDSAISYFEAHELAFDAFFLLFCQGLAPDEVAF